MIDRKWLEMCATAGELLYGEYSVAAIKKLYESKPGHTVSNEDLITTMQELESAGTILMTYVQGRLQDRDDPIGFFLPVECEGTPLEKVMRQADEAGNPYASLHFDEEERLQLATDCPEDIDYWVPTAKQIEELVSTGYITTPQMTALINQIKKLGGQTEFLGNLWSRISTDKIDPMEIVQEVLDGADINFRNERDVQSLLPYIMNFANMVNHRNRKGWPPSELGKRTPRRMNGPVTIMPGSVHAAEQLKGMEGELRSMGMRLDMSSIDSFNTIGPYGERRTVKVGRNDPCPCGSGKKYKNCHGR